MGITEGPTVASVNQRTKIRHQVRVRSSQTDHAQRDSNMTVKK